MSSKKVITTNQAPAAIGPYSQAVRVGDLLFVSGQIPLDPHSGEIVGGTTLEQTHQVMKNLKAILASEGLGFSDLVKTSVFLQDLSEFTDFNECYAQYMETPYPARACVEVSKLPRGVRVEIEAIACYS